MIVPQGKKGLSYSSWQLKLLFHGDTIVPHGKANELPPRKGPSSLENICFETFNNHSHFISIFI